MKARQGFMRLGVCLAAITLGSLAQAQVHLNIPEDAPGPPFYANIARGGMPLTGEWWAVIFYRTPACIPADFNLLNVFDPPRAFSCDLQIEGHANWRSLDDSAPADLVWHGTGAVPVWFVRLPELQAAVADDELTIGELATLPSLLIGSASFFLESTRNSIVEQRGGNEAVVASGMLTDGRSFQLEFTEKFREGEHLFPHVRIEFH